MLRNTSEPVGLLLSACHAQEVLPVRVVCKPIHRLAMHMVGSEGDMLKSPASRAPRCRSGPNCPLEGAPDPPPCNSTLTGGPFPQATALPSPPSKKTKNGWLKFRDAANKENHRSLVLEGIEAGPRVRRSDCWPQQASSLSLRAHQNS